MSFNSSWVPDEDAQTLFAERCWLQGVIISSIAYGITISLSVLSFRALVRPKKNHVEFKKRLPLLIYTTFSFILATLFMISLAAFTQMAFIDDRNYPGGPSVFEDTMYSIPIDETNNAAFVLSNWMSSAFVVWRLKVIYQECRVPIWIVIFFPCLMLAGSVAMGIMFLIQLSTTDPYFTLPYLCLSLGLNVILTIAIVLRLLTVKHRIVSVLSPLAKRETQYTSITAMTIESASLYSVTSIAFLVLFGIDNAVLQVFIQSLSQFQTIATLLIVFRVAQGKGWTTETATRVMTTWGSEPSDLGRMEFASRGASLTLECSGEAEKIICGCALA